MSDLAENLQSMLVRLALIALAIVVAPVIVSWMTGDVRIVNGLMLFVTLAIGVTVGLLERSAEVKQVARAGMRRALVEVEAHNKTCRLLEAITDELHQGKTQSRQLKELVQQARRLLREKPDYPYTLSELMAGHDHNAPVPSEIAGFMNMKPVGLERLPDTVAQPPQKRSGSQHASN